METAATPGSTSRRGRRAAYVTVSIALVASLIVLVWNAPKISAWYRTWTLFERVHDNSQGYPEYRHRRTGLLFVRLPEGSFLMGAPREEILSFSRELSLGSRFVESVAESQKQHAVTLSPFLIAKYEVTQEEWSEIMGGVPPLLTALSQRSQGPRFPIEMIAWEDAQRFCVKTGLSLPSEAQWEYACRARSTACFSGTGVLEEIAWYKSNSSGQSHEVGTKQPNGFGLHDMHGNVEEWCLDEFDSHFYGSSPAEGINPVCKNGVGTYVKRGGNYNGMPFNCRSAARSNEGPGSQGHGTGMRPVFSLR